MKKVILALVFLFAMPAFAGDQNPLNLNTFGPNRYFCYYRDDMGYLQGAGGTSLGQAKTRALRACRESNRGRNDHGGGSCSFAGCRAI